VVLPGTVIPAGELWSGNPAAKLRTLTAEEQVVLKQSAAASSKLSEEHLAEVFKTVAEIEEDVARHEYRQENYMEHDDPIPTGDVDVERYYKLSSSPEDQGLFRTKNFNDEEVLAAIQVEQAAADAEEEEHLAYLASRDRVWATLLQLGDVRADRPAERDAIIKALERVDPKGAKYLTGLLGRASAAAGDEAASAAIATELQDLAPRGEHVNTATALAAVKTHGATKLSA